MLNGIRTTISSVLRGRQGKPTLQRRVEKQIDHLTKAIELELKSESRLIRVDQPQSGAQNGVTVLLIDSQLRGVIDHLRADLELDCSGCEVRYFDSKQNFLRQAVKILQPMADIDTVHILTANADLHLDSTLLCHLLDSRFSDEQPECRSAPMRMKPLTHTTQKSNCRL